MFRLNQVQKKETFFDMVCMIILLVEKKFQIMHGCWY